MQELFDPLISSPLLALFVLTGLGMLLGNIQLWGISLGSSGVIFVALFAGHWGCTVPPEIGRIGLVLFVYCVGVGAGGRFFGALQRQGSQLAKLALLIIGVGALLTWALGTWLGMDHAMAVGIFAGALTSTPALAAALEGAGSLGDQVVVGYGVAYPFGVIGVVLFVQLLPRLMGKNLDEGQEEEEAKQLCVERQLVEVTNPNMVGKRISDSVLLEIGACQISRIWNNDRLEPVHYEDTLQAGQQVLLVGETKAIAIATELIGKPVERSLNLNADDERRNFVITNTRAAGKTIREINPLKNHGVVITRISRMEFEFVPESGTCLEPNDVITVVGEPGRLKAFESFVGHRAQSFSQTSLVSLAVGLALGIAVGQIAFPLPGGNSFSLGLAGGPLLVALILGHFGKMAGIVGHIPRPTRMLLQEMGLVFFLADAGTKGGATMVEAVASQGVQIFLIGIVITLLPMCLGYIIARKIFGMSLPQSLGGICGGMTSTPALGAITAKTSLQSPIVSYATAYPVAVVMMAVLAKLLLQLMA